MNEAMHAETVTWLKSIRGQAAEQVPGVAKEMVAMGIVWHVLMMLLAIALILAVIAFAQVSFRKKWWENRDYGMSFDAEVFLVFAAIGSSLVAIVSTIAVVINAYWLFVAIATPRLYALSCVAGMLPGK